MRRLEDPPIDAIRPPLPVAEGHARFASVAAWLPDIPNLSALSLPRSPSPVHLRDEEMELENTERRGSSESAGKNGTVLVDDVNGDIELQELEKEENGGD
jgi:hypothetical protein